MLRVIFVCSGNICRSPMAEGIMKKMARDRGLSAAVLSMGTLNLVGRSASSNAIAACAEIGVNIEYHASQGLGRGILEAATHVLVMEQHHADAVKKVAPAAAANTTFLGAWDQPAQPEISDPVGKDIEAFRRCRDRIVLGLEHFLDQHERLGRV